ncbi:MAG: hypothetical protein LC130_32015 [Bryobacterales bacterium]|nr:hypothetical protein [Bryobacterales bacterium]MEB2361015.1 hypothetical protein [Bryobacterales bacterium]
MRDIVAQFGGAHAVDAGNLAADLSRELFRIFRVIHIDHDFEMQVQASHYPDDTMVLYMLCKICETRRPRRYCPGVMGDICSLCCGTEREQTVDCPLECEYLQDARRHEKLPDIDPNEFPNKDIEVTERFLREHEHLLLQVAGSLLRGAMETRGAVDQDVREALASLIRTYRTLESGLYYETVPSNPFAAGIHHQLQEALKVFREQLARELGLNTVRDTDVLGVLVFLQRLELQHNNGRRRGRAFIDFLRQHFPMPPSVASEAPDGTAGSPIILG